SRFRVIRQRNGGESAARNTGLSHTRSEWLVFLDSDDWVLPNYLERMMAASAEPDADVVHCGGVRVTHDWRRSSSPFAPARQDLFLDLAQYNCFPVHACLVRRRIIERVGPFEHGRRTCADWDFWQRVARLGPRFVAVPEVLACYRLRPASSATGARQLL